MEWVPAPTPINENRRAQATEKTGIIGTDQVYLFDIYLEIAKDISGYEGGSFSLYDSKNQCSISAIGFEKELHQKNNKSDSICSYVLLKKNPTTKQPNIPEPICAEANNVESFLLKAA